MLHSSFILPLLVCWLDASDRASRDESLEVVKGEVGILRLTHRPNPKSSAPNAEVRSSHNAESNADVRAVTPF